MKKTVIICNICNEPISNQERYIQAVEQPPIGPLLYVSHQHIIGPSNEEHYHLTCLLRAIEKTREVTHETI